MSVTLNRNFAVATYRALGRSLKQAGRLIREILGTRNGQLAFVLLIPILLGTLLAPVIAPFDPTEPHIADKLVGPNSKYLFGTDHLGRDLFSRVLYGGRATFLLAFSSVGLSVLFGVPVGLVSGYLGGTFDEITMRIVDTLLTIPSLLLALLVVAMLGANMVNAVIAITLVYTPRMARLTRSSVLSVKSEEYVTAARARGESVWYICFREILPNVSGPIIVEASIRLGFAMLLGTTLSFLGLGTQPPFPDWGYMIAVARDHMWSSIWFVLWPSLALGATIFGFNLLGDSLRDVLDPQVETEGI